MRLTDNLAGRNLGMLLLGIANSYRPLAATQCENFFHRHYGFGSTCDPRWTLGLAPSLNLANYCRCRLRHLR